MITTRWVGGERGGQAENLFHDPERRPTAQERRPMFALLLELMVMRVMKNHIYSFNGVNKLQQDGGPIGLKLSGAVAKVVMLSWSRRFVAAATTALASFAYFQLYLLLFYVDDTGIAVEELEPGCRFIEEEGRVRVVQEEVENDRAVAGDLRTARVLQMLQIQYLTTFNSPWTALPTTHQAGCHSWQLRSGWPRTTPLTTSSLRRRLPASTS